MNTLYEQSWLYDLIHDKAPDGREVGFYERQIELYGSPVLELACGSGNYLVTLSHRDIEISGIDISNDMLHAAERRAERENTETNLINADMRDFDLGQKFRLVFIAGNSLQHLNTYDDVARCFDSVKKHLAPGGKFIVEIFNPSIGLLNRSPEERFFVGEYKTENGWVVLTENVRYDAATQINHLEWHYKNQFMKEEQTVSFTMRQFFPQEFDLLFELGGFRIDRKFGDFDETEFSARSPKQIVVASLL